MKVTRDTLLADSGFLIALFDAREPHHAAAQRFLQRQPQPLVTVEAVVVEVSFFLAGHQRRAFLDAVAAAALPVMLPGPSSYKRIAELFGKYDTLAPDYADLALVDLAECVGVHAVLTLDVHDFSIYRIKGRKTFDLVNWML